MTLDQNAAREAERAYNETVNYEFNCNRHALEDAILAYLAQVQETVSEDEVERGARGIALRHAKIMGHAWPDKFVEANWREVAESARACLTAARRKG